MKKGFIIFIFLTTIFSVTAQEQEMEKDTIIETEVVNVVTSYNPKIANAKKINKNPTIDLLKKNDRKKLKYTIYSAPVASTFTPQTGVVKGINVGLKERIYNNYLAAGYGNYGSTYLESYFYHNTRFDNEFGLSAKYAVSEENVNNSILNSNFLNFNADAFFKQEARYFDWTVFLNAQKNNYNWYGLPDRVFAETVINSINEEQQYNYYNIAGDFKFHDSYIEHGKISLSFFEDNFSSSEIHAKFDTKLNLPLDYFTNNLNDISINAGVEYLTGYFKNNYQNTSSVNYNLITINLNPEYKLKSDIFSLNAGLKTFVSLDPENNVTNLFIYPDVLAQSTILKKYVHIYGGFTGNLHTNTYKQFTEENPYVSPTLFITQTAETSNLFIGLKGNITRDVSYNIKASSRKEEDKPLFLRNNSKSDGTTTLANGNLLKGYEYGNSFSIYYDDVKTSSLFAEAEYLFNKNITFSTQIQYDNYTTTNSLENWNLPELQASFLGKYKKDKWFVTTNIFYVSERKDALYNAKYPSSLRGIKTLKSFVDVNLDGGYHFNDKFSAFLRFNNILNTKYQRFANFDTQGFQVLGGITYKFDF